MKEEIKIPAMGESVVEATIGTFLKETGASVKEGEEIVEIETEKVNQLLYAPKSGRLEWKTAQGDKVNIGDVIGSVDTEQQGEEKPSKKQKEEKPVEKKAPPPPQPSPPSPPKEKEPAPKKRDTRETRKPMSRIRKVIARRLVESLHNAAMLTTFNEVDMTAVQALRSQHKENFLQKHGVKLGLMSFFVKAVVEALKEFPQLNSYIDGEEIVHREYYDIGIAVGSEKGLVVPVVRDCDRLSFGEIEKTIAGFAAKAKEGKLTMSELEGGGFTITNGGVFGSLLSTPILNPPQVGILGMHKILLRPIALQEQVVIRPMMYLALSYDHRIVDGREAVSFLVKVKEIIEDPTRLLLDE